MMSEAVEQLSLATFDPVYAKEPYLNTPRSIEACRRHGVQPVELVEIPYREFQRAFPDDPEGAMRRFERIDGARRALLDAVVAEWEELCNTGFTAEVPEHAGGETIITVDPEAYSTVLEIQAAQFRKIEQQQWKSLQKIIFNEMRAAARDVESKRIIRKQESIGEYNRKLLRDRDLAREEIRRQLEADRKRKEEEREEEVRAAQRLYMEQVQREKAMEEENKRKERANQMRLAQERLRREEQFKQTKDNIFQKMRADAEERQKQLNDKEKELSDRMKAEREKREAEAKEKKDKVQARLSKAKEELEVAEQEKRDAISRRLDEFEQRLHNLNANRAKTAKENKEQKDGELNEKLQKIREMSDALLNEKINRTLNEMEKKDAAAIAELQRMEEERERRRKLKNIRQEAHQLAATRQQRAKEYKLQATKRDLERKEARYKAIKDGEKMLHKMRDRLSDVVVKSRNDILTNIRRLSSQDMLSPEAVAEEVTKLSTAVLFPRLEHSFAIGGEDSSESPAQHRRKHSRRPSTTATASSTSNRNRRSRPTTSNADASPTSPTSPLKEALPLVVFTAENMCDTLEHMKDQISHKDLGSSANGNNSAKKPMRSRGGNRRTPSRPSSKKDENSSPVFLTTNGEDDERCEEQNGGEFSLPQVEAPSENPFSAWSIEEDQTPASAGQKTRQYHSLPIASDEFRAEFSADHPLAGGRGRYEKEKRKGKHRAAGTYGPGNSSNVSKREEVEDEDSMERLTYVISKQEKKKQELQKQLDSYRKQQNALLLKVLEEERIAEENRNKLAKSPMDNDERNKLELVFAEERRRASERIIAMTREHEAKLKELVLRANFEA